MYFEIFRWWSQILSTVPHREPPGTGDSLLRRLQALPGAQDRLWGCDAHQMHARSYHPYLSWQLLRQVHWPVSFAKCQSRRRLWHADCHWGSAHRYADSLLPSRRIVYFEQGREEDSYPYILLASFKECEWAHEQCWSRMYHRSCCQNG